MALTSCTAQVAEIKQLTHDVREVTFKLNDPSTLEYIAGQYMVFRVPAPDKPKGISRLYSLCSAPGETGVLKIVYNYVGGPGTAFLQKLAEGSEVAFKAPAGKFVLQEDSTRDVLFAATGTGIGPFLGILKEYLPKIRNRQFTLLWSVKYPKDIYYKELFEGMEKEFQNFRCLMSVTRSEDRWKGLSGRITALFPKYFPTVDNIEVYACGTEAMIDELKVLCDERGGCPFHREIYF